MFEQTARESVLEKHVDTAIARLAVSRSTGDWLISEMKRIRKARGLSQAAVARRMGYGDGTPQNDGHSIISLWERRRNTPDFASLLLWMSALDVTIMLRRPLSDEEEENRCGEDA